MGQLRGVCTWIVLRVGRMETAPKPGRDIPPKKDRLQTKKKVEIFLGRKESFQARGRRGGARAANPQGCRSARGNRQAQPA